MAKTEHELSQLVIDDLLGALIDSQAWPPKPGSRHESFLERGLHHFLDTLPGRIDWWQMRRRDAATPATVGWCWFSEHIDSLSYLFEHGQELLELPFAQRFERVAVVVILGKQELKRPGSDEWTPELEDFLQEMSFATDAMQRLIAVQELGADTFLPPRPNSDCAFLLRRAASQGV
jgi:hypothetical protein